MCARGLWILLPVLVVSYNIDVKHPIIYKDPLTAGSESNHSAEYRSSYFGYTVLLYAGPNETSSRLFIGAPRSNYTSSLDRSKFPNEPGVVYRCPLLQKCNQIKPEIIQDEKNFPHYWSLKTVIKNQQSWFGAAMAVQEPTAVITVCAPRTVVLIKTPEGHVYPTMHGMCYTASTTSEYLDMEDMNLPGIQFDREKWPNPMHGFSIHYAPEEPGTKVSWRIRGDPMHHEIGAVEMRNGNVSQINETRKEHKGLQLFGYAVTSGHFFEKNQLMFAIGMPGWNFVGQVTVMHPRDRTNITVFPKDIGQFFGGSLTAGDLNGDDLDELVVGAPHYGLDHGRVYIYSVSTTGTFGTPVFLDGSVEGGQFGYSLASGDLDGDGLADIIVGAPWEESGVIYIYNGQSDLQEKSFRKPSQRIVASTISSDIQRFGFSLSAPVDIDFNGYPEVGVGAYKSGHAIILRGKPVIKTTISVTAHPNSLLNTDQSFVIEVCMKHSGRNASSVHYFNVTARIDEDHNRVQEGLLLLPNLTASPDTYSCFNRTIKLMKRIENFRDPIKIYVNHKIENNDSVQEVLIDGTSQEQELNDTFCKSCPVEDERRSQEPVQLTVPFNSGCGVNKVCNSNISIYPTIDVGRNDNIWVIGSGPINLNVVLENHGDPAYNTEVQFSIPHGVTLRSISPSCLQKIHHNILTVTCNVDNPLNERIEKPLSLGLYMQHLNQKPELDGELFFNVSVKTLSMDHGPGNVTVPLRFRSEASLTVSGHASEESYFFERTGMKDVQHTYQVLKSGATAVIEASLTVKVPVGFISSNNSFLRVYEPQLYTSGKLSQCSSHITFLELHSDASSTEVQIDEFSLFPSDIMHISSVNNTRNSEERESEEFETDLIENATSLAQMESIYSANAIMGMTENIQDQNNESSDVSTGATNFSPKTVHLNCLTEDVACMTITCSLGSFKTSQDEGKLTLNMVLFIDEFPESFGENVDIIRLSTMAHVEIIQPAMSPAINESGQSMAKVSTIFYKTPEKQKVATWILLGSVALGIVLLFILIGILCVVGFFRRRQKENLRDLKANQS